MTENAGITSDGDGTDADGADGHGTDADGADGHGTDGGATWQAGPLASRAAQQWAQLSDRQRVLLISAAAAELSLKIAALVDIGRRPADQIRGPKALWRAAMAVNLLGPVSYFLFGRRRA